MIVRAISATNDWEFGKGRNDYRSANEALSQLIKTRLQSFLGDCFFAINDGLDWFNLLGSKNQIALELAVRALILNTEGVTGIVSFVIDLNSSTRRITMTYTVNTIYTRDEVTGEIFGGTSLLLTEDGDFLTTEDGVAIATG